MVSTWTYRLVMTDQQAENTIKQLLTQWRLPQRIRGALRIKKNYRINDKIVPTSYVLQVGDRLSLKFDDEDFRTSESHYQPNSTQQVTIIFENDDLVVVNKPAGMKMHPHSPNEDDTLLNYLADNFNKRQLTSAENTAKPYMVHRIDRETSGLVIVAKNPVVVPILNRMIAEKKIKRIYLAWVDGKVASLSGVINEPIGIDVNDSRKRAVNGMNAQPAITHWVRVHTVFQKTLLRLQLDTGRMHQIRVHLANMNHPIVGDSLYNTTKVTHRMLLHAATIDLPLPFGQRTVIVTAPIPKDFPRQLLSE